MSAKDSQSDRGHCAEILPIQLWVTVANDAPVTGCGRVIPFLVTHIPKASNSSWAKVRIGPFRPVCSLKLSLNR